MFSKIRFIGLGIAAFLMIYSCNSKKKGQTAAQRKDSLAQVRRQQRQDSLARVKRDSMARVNAKQDSLRRSKQKSTVSFSENGQYAIRLGSWRSKVKASKRAERWKKRGYSSVSVIQYGNTATGNVWFRVQIGRVDSREQAQRLQQQIKQKYQQASWVSDIS